MLFKQRALVGLALACSAASVMAADENTALKQEITELRARLNALEQRLDSSEQQPPVASSSGANAGNKFNPSIGVIFQGQAWKHQQPTDNYAIAGFPAGGEGGPITSGVAIGETELDFSANVDDKFTAWLTVPLEIEDGETSVSIEEAWIETTALPGGFAARMGKFYSGVGYLNGKHAHAWDFVDQPLAYQALMGNQYGDDGLQLRWLAPTDIYLELGAEILRGAAFPAGGADHSGTGSWSLFSNIGGDVGISSSWLTGLSWLQTSSEDRASGDESDPLLFNGNSDTLIAHGVWKWAPNGNWKQRNAIVQAEYLRQNNDGNYTLSDGSTPLYEARQSGWNVQAIYQPFEQWRFGTRFDTLSMQEPGAVFSGTALAAPGSDPKRYSLMVDWSNSEFSRVRLQFTHDMASPQTDNQFGLQYIYSIGAHGAHSF